SREHRANRRPGSLRGAARDSAETHYTPLRDEEAGHRPPTMGKTELRRIGIVAPPTSDSLFMRGRLHGPILQYWSVHSVRHGLRPKINEQEEADNRESD